MIDFAKVSRQRLLSSCQSVYSSFTPLRIKKWIKGGCIHVRSPTVLFSSARFEVVGPSSSSKKKASRRRRRQQSKCHHEFVVGVSLPAVCVFDALDVLDGGDDEAECGGHDVLCVGEMSWMNRRSDELVLEEEEDQEMLLFRVGDVAARDELRLVLESFGCVFAGPLRQRITEWRRKIGVEEAMLAEPSVSRRSRFDSSAAMRIQASLRRKGGLFRSKGPTSTSTASKSGSNSSMSSLLRRKPETLCQKLDVYFWTNEALLYYMKKILDSHVEDKDADAAFVLDLFQKSDIDGKYLVEMQLNPTELRSFLHHGIPEDFYLTDVTKAAIRRLWKDRCFSVTRNEVLSKLWFRVEFDVRKEEQWDSFDHLSWCLSDVACAARRFFSTVRIFIRKEGEDGEERRIASIPENEVQLLPAATAMTLLDDPVSVSVCPLGSDRSQKRHWVPVWVVFRERGADLNTLKLDLNSIDDVVDLRSLMCDGREDVRDLFDPPRLIIGVVVGSWYHELHPDGNGLVIPRRFHPLKPSDFFFPRFAQIRDQKIINEMPYRLARVVTKYNVMPMKGDSSSSSSSSIDFVNDVLECIGVSKLLGESNTTMFGRVSGRIREFGHFLPSFTITRDLIEANAVFDTSTRSQMISSLSVGENVDVSTHKLLDEFVNSREVLHVSKLELPPRISHEFAEERDYITLLDRFFFLRHLFFPDEASSAPLPAGIPGADAETDQLMSEYETGCPYGHPRRRRQYTMTELLHDLESSDHVVFPMMLERIVVGGGD